MNKAMHLVLKALSDPETKLDLQKSRRIMNLKILDPFKPFYRTLDTKIYNEGREVPVRIYFPNEESYDTVDIEAFQEKNKSLDTGKMSDNIYPVILYIHGGGFVPLRYNNDKRKKPLFSRGLSVCRHLFNSFSKLKCDEKIIEKRRLFH